MWWSSTSIPGVDVGVVSLTGELVKSQLKLRKIKDDHELKRIVRKADAEDIALWHTARQREDDTLREARQIIKRLGISMKLTDVEFQATTHGRRFTTPQSNGWIFETSFASWQAPSTSASTCAKSEPGKRPRELVALACAAESSVAVLGSRTFAP